MMMYIELPIKQHKLKSASATALLHSSKVAILTDDYFIVPIIVAVEHS